MRPTCIQVLEKMISRCSVHIHIYTEKMIGNDTEIASMASIKYFSVVPVVVAALFFSGFLILGAAEPSKFICGGLCEEGVYITCANYPGVQFETCDCECKPPDGQFCVVHAPDGWTQQCSK
ncbi:hypothetical protein ACP4OV_026270 [Aristida adscensionis]